MARCAEHLDWDRNIDLAEKWAQTLPVNHPNVVGPTRRAQTIQRLIESNGHSIIPGMCPDETDEELEARCG